MASELFPFSVARTSDDAESALAGSVAQQLEMALAVGLLNDGDKLPTEIDLAAELGVSTVTLRQALSILRSKRMIETRRGRGGGSYVRDSSAYSRDQVEDQLRSKSIHELRDLGDARASSAGSAARLAALRALPEDVDRLRKFAEEFATAGTAAAFRRSDSRFHIEVGVAAQSPRLTMMIVQLQGETAPLLWLPDTGSTGQSAHEHLQILEAIEARDPQRAQTLATEHCERETRVLIDRHLKLAAA